MRRRRQRKRINQQRKGQRQYSAGQGGEGTEKRRGNTPAGMSNWERVVDLVQAAFGEERFVEENMWKVVVLIPKGNRDYLGIRLVEVIWKVVANISNLWIIPSITFHDFLHGFWAGRGMVTTTLKAKLIQQLAALRGGFLCVISLHLHKSYESLDKSRCLVILEVCGVGPQVCLLLRTYWNRLRIVAKAGGYYGAEFKCAKGVTQGDPLSSTISNLMLDSVVQHWVRVMAESMEE